MDLQALPETPVELKCPLCSYKGSTVVRKSNKDRGKVVLFWVVATVLVATFFVFILIYLLLHMIICKKDRMGGCGDCCSCSGCLKSSGRFQPKVHLLHYCGGCKKQIGMAK
jgi:hypothetical protein